MVQRLLFLQLGQIDTPEGTINVPAGMDDMGPITKKLYDTLTWHSTW